MSTHRITYRLTAEPADGPVVFSNRPAQTRHADGTFTVPVSLANAIWRAEQSGRTFDAEDAARRIVAIAHPGHVEPEHVEILAAEPPLPGATVVLLRWADDRYVSMSDEVNLAFLRRTDAVRSFRPLTILSFIGGPDAGTVVVPRQEVVATAGA